MKRIVLFAILVFASAQAWSESTRILVRPKPGVDVRRVAELSRVLRIADTNTRYLGRSNVRLWTSPMPRKEVEALLQRHRESFVFEFVTGDYRDIVWPVDPRATLPRRVQGNLESLKARDNSRRIQLLQIREREIAAAYLRRGLARDKTLPAPASLRWQLFPNLTLTTTRTAWRLHDRRGERIGYVGDVDVSKGGERYSGGFVSATFFDGNLYARFEHGKSIYQVIPLGEGFHAAVEVDASRVPEDQPDLPVVGDGPGEQPDLGYCGGLADLPVVGDGPGEQPDLPVVGDGPGEQPDLPVVGDGPGEQPDLPVVGDGPGEQPDLGYCASACIGVPTARGQVCNSGPRTCAIVRVGVGFTDEALRSLPSVTDAASVRWNVSIPADADHYAQFLVDLTAASFTRSGIHARVRLAGVGRFSGLERPADMTQQLMELRGLSPSQDVQAVWQWRSATRSDVVMMLTTLDRRSITTGTAQTTMQRVAGLSPPWTNNPRPQDAYSIVQASNADSNLSFLHELGHHFGAMHDDRVASMPHWYGRGYRHGCDFRTVMGYAPQSGCSNGVPRLAMWSSCGLWHFGMPMGSLQQNNVRVINERAGRIGSFRP